MRQPEFLLSLRNEEAKVPRRGRRDTSMPYTRVLSLNKRHQELSHLPGPKRLHCRPWRKNRPRSVGYDRGVAHLPGTEQGEGPWPHANHCLRRNQSLGAGPPAWAGPCKRQGGGQPAPGPTRTADSPALRSGRLAPASEQGPPTPLSRQPHASPSPCWEPPAAAGTSTPSCSKGP